MIRMMKTVLCFLGVLLWTGNAALATTPLETQAVLNAKSYLTEVYGYTNEDAEQFDFRLAGEEEPWVLSFAPLSHPGWVYTARVNPTDGGLFDLTCPFSTSYANYPGQNSVKGILYLAEEKGWFARWDETAWREFDEALTAFDIKRNGPSGPLFSGLMDMSAAQVIQHFFVACYGEPLGWTGAVKEWRDEVLAIYGLTLETESVPPADGVQTYEVESKRLGCVMNVTQFAGEAPSEIAPALAHPKLGEWMPMCGAYVVAHRETALPGLSFPDRGLAAFARGEERLLVMLTRAEQAQPWQVVPVREKALLPGRELSITFSPEDGLFTLAYPLSATERESFRAGIEYNGSGLMLCSLAEYRHIDDAAGKGVVIDNRSERFGARNHWYHITQYAAEHPPVEELADKIVPGYLDYIDAAAFPKTAESCKAAESRSLPEEYGVVAGVHLRKETSSRSADLGMYEQGALVRVLEIVPGNPHPWAHVMAGSMEGYMSTVYVAYPGAECTIDVAQCRPLAVAMTRESVALKKGTGWLDGTVAELAPGTKMHVLATIGDWLHVMIPAQGEPSWLMDVNGMDGYVKAGSVKTAATSLQLDWLP